jgi:hypothetical protein
MNEFSLEHYTYINQIFGDITVRDIIAEVFPNKKYKFMVKEDIISDSHHHYLIDVDTMKEICSVDNGYQNIYIDTNDNLCQSYSLLSYFNIPITQDKIQRQMEMINLYRKIINNKEFIKRFNDIIVRWIDYTKKNCYLSTNKNILIKNIRNVLRKWKKFGYNYFIGFYNNEILY